MNDRVSVGRLGVASCLYDFVEGELLPDAGLDPNTFWAGFGRMVANLAPQNRALLEERDRLQSQLDCWHRTHPAEAGTGSELEAFLREVGYLVSEPADFCVSTTGVDPELSEVAGPQLVVPVLNARFALNAANARWGSLYDALYGSDVISAGGGAEPGRNYNPLRGRKVVDFVRAFLDESFPLAAGSHFDVVSYVVSRSGLSVQLADGRRATLTDPAQYRGYSGDPGAPDEVVLRHHGLHVVVRFDRRSPIGSSDQAGICDVEVEAAVTTIVDFEDSVSAVDAEDKVAAYRNWLGLSRGTLSVPVTKGASTFERTLNQDRRFSAADGGVLVLPGRSLLLVRNVGHLMTSDAVIDADLGPVPEGVLDAVITTLAALPGLRADNPFRNSHTGSVYIVKPKMHGPAEVAFADRLFDAVEDLLQLPATTIKMGVMDEERRTSANLKASLRAAANRVVFVNTGFLDRTGDEIHTSMEAGVMVRKAEMKEQAWIEAYEASNVDVALAVGLRDRAQIGKGMWAMPDRMADMYAQKVGQLMSGASTAWVPSPTAATIHALHYHQVDVSARQAELAGHTHSTLAELLTVPLGDPSCWTTTDVQQELDNNSQSILGYVVRWIDQGVGCSKVPDITGVALMEDRATLRISSQLLANWLRHDVVTAEDVRHTLERMAEVVDSQNADDPSYEPMCLDLDHNIAFATALELIIDGARQPNGYTEPILHRRRRERKAADRARRPGLPEDCVASL